MRRHNLKFSWIGMALAPMFLSGCSIDTVSSHEVASQAIYQDYDLRYSEEADATTFDATFRLGGSTGTTVRLSPPSELRVNEEHVNSHWFLGTHYSKTVAKTFRPDTVVKFTDPDGQTYVNVLTIRHVSLVDAPAIRFGAPYTIQFHAVSGESTDTITAELTQTQNAVSPTVSIIATAHNHQSGSVTFRSEDINKLTAGKADLTLRRTSHVPLLQTTREGGSAHASYTTRKVQVTVEGSSVRNSGLAQR